MAKRRSNSVRIIGGRWRGRRIRFPAAPGLRPSADRRRETLFNWLADRVEGATCLDLFAGSGALGLEAASRGADRVTLVEASREVAAALAASVRTLEAGERVAVVHAQVARFLNRDPVAADLVFVDPPFAEPRLAGDTLARLARGGWLAPGARVYLELDARGRRPATPEGWTLVRERTAGDAHALLYAVADDDPPGDTGTGSR